MFEGLSESQQLVLLGLILLVMFAVLGVVVRAFFLELKRRKEAIPQEPTPTSMPERPERERRPRRQRVREVPAESEKPVDEEEVTSRPQRRSRPKEEEPTTMTALPTLSPEERLYYYGQTTTGSPLSEHIRSKLVGMVAVLAFFIIRAYFGLALGDGLWDWRYHGAMMVMVIASLFLNITGTLGNGVVNFLLFTWALMMLF